jgi:hypothetical protein
VDRIVKEDDVGEAVADNAAPQETPTEEPDVPDI